MGSATLMRFLHGMNSHDASNGTRRTAPSIYGSLSSVVLVIGLYNGVAPFVVRFVFGGDRLLLAFPLHLPSPWWWVVSLAVLVVTVVLLEVLDRGGQRAERVQAGGEAGPDGG